MGHRNVPRGRKVAGFGFIIVASLLAAQQARAGGAPTLVDLKNLSYRGIYDDPVTLTDGHYEGAPFVAGGASRPRVALVEALYRLGDLDGDGLDESAVLLTESSGGSGSDSYLAAVGRDGDQIKNLGTALIGDRVQIRSLDLRSKRIVMELVASGLDDPACCPTQMIRQAFELRDGDLIESGSEQLSQLSLEDLQGPTWQLSHLAWNEAVPGDIKITAVFDGDKISGAAGCNQYFSGVTASGPYDVTISSAGATRMASPASVMELEDRYLLHLENVTQFGFLLGKLALTYQGGDTWGTLLFVPTE